MSLVKLHILPFSLLSLLFIAQAFAGQTGCPDHFVDGQAPDFINEKLSLKSKEICYSGFALKHSGVTRTPLYAAEYLTREHLTQAGGLKRSSKFYPDPSLQPSERAELRHYARSGYDRGHVAPSGDMPNPESQQECFTLANMVPQIPSVNRGVWERVEVATRKLARERGGVFVVTGPIYSGATVQKIGGAVMVPTKMFKAVYDPLRNECGANIVDNVEGGEVQVVTIAELEKLSGISVFPSLSSQIKNNGMRLPAALERKQRGGV